jgi:hypothetical protein
MMTYSPVAGCLPSRTTLSVPLVTAGKNAGFNAKSEIFFNLLESMAAYGAQSHRLKIVFPKDLLIDAISVSSKTPFGFYCKQPGFVKCGYAFCLKSPCGAEGEEKANLARYAGA